MPTTVEDFISTIQCCHLWFKKDVELLFKAKLAHSRYWGVRLSPIYEFPCHCWLCTFREVWQDSGFLNEFLWTASLDLNSVDDSPM